MVAGAAPAYASQKAFAFVLHTTQIRIDARQHEWARVADLRDA
jgi:hypothetical protein